MYSKNNVGHIGQYTRRVWFFLLRLLITLRQLLVVVFTGQKPVPVVPAVMLPVGTNVGDLKVLYTFGLCLYSGERKNVFLTTRRGGRSEDPGS